MFKADTSSNSQIVDYICIKCHFPYIPEKYTITHLAKITNQGVRIALKSIGSFSLYWKSIGQPNKDTSIFVGSKLKSPFATIDNEIESGLISVNNYGFVQLIYYENKRGFNNAYLRIFNFYNHYNSKTFKEVSIGPVKDWVALIASFDIDAIVVVWGSKIYKYNTYVLPYLELNSKVPNKKVEFVLVADNGFSNQTLKVTMVNTTFDSFVPTWAVVLIFTFILVTTSIIIYWVNKEDNVAKQKKTRDSSKISMRETYTKTLSNGSSGNSKGAFKKTSAKTTDNIMQESKDKSKIKYKKSKKTSSSFKIEEGEDQLDDSIKDSQIGSMYIKSSVISVRWFK